MKPRNSQTNLTLAASVLSCEALALLGFIGIGAAFLISL